VFPITNPPRNTVVTNLHQIPQNCPLPWGSQPNLTTVPLPHPTYHPKQQLDRFTHSRTAPQILHSLQWAAPYPSTKKLPLTIYTARLWTHPTYHTKRHLHLITHYSTIYWTDLQTDRFHMQITSNNINFAN